MLEFFVASFFNIDFDFIQPRNTHISIFLDLSCRNTPKTYFLHDYNFFLPCHFAHVLYVQHSEYLQENFVRQIGEGGIFVRIQTFPHYQHIVVIRSMHDTFAATTTSSSSTSSADGFSSFSRFFYFIRARLRLEKVFQLPLQIS